jgi:hypothetical protein
MTELPRLHDATLQNMNLDWEAGTISLTLQVGPAASDLGELRAEGLTDFACPRLMPWGPSNSVNGISTEDVAGGKLIAVEMQSGDLIKIQCRTAGYWANKPSKVTVET